MLDKADKKAIMLYILKTLEIHTDAEHPLTHEQIAQRLEKDFGLDKPSRNTIANHINILRDGLDYDIRYGAGNKGVYLVDRILPAIHLKALISQLATAKSLPSENAQNLIKALESLHNKHFRGLKNTRSVKNYIHQRNEQFFNNLEIIDTAINKGLQISCTYNDIGLKGELVPRKQGDKKLIYILHPYEMACVDGFYYLIASAFDYNELRHFRIDHITEIMPLENQKRIPLEKITGYSGCISFDLPKYVREHVLMFNGKIERITFIADRYILNYVWDVFGDRAQIKAVKNNPKQIEFTVHTTAEAAKIFAKQYCTSCQLISPEQIRRELSLEFNNVAEKYK